MALKPWAHAISGIATDIFSTNTLEFRDCVSDYYRSEKLKYCSTRRCRICHGSVNWLFTTVSVLLAAEKVEHEWLEYETENAYYCTQLYGNSVIALERFTSQTAANNYGLDCVGRSHNTSVWTQRSYTYSKDDSRDVGSLKDGIRNLARGNLTYDLLNFNCKRYCNIIYQYV